MSKWTEFVKLSAIGKRGVIPGENVYVNHRYQVHVGIQRQEGNAFATAHLSIKRLDKTPIRNWRDLQRIKNDLLGKETEAFEVFPAESNLVDTSNQYHIWAVLKVTEDGKLQSIPIMQALNVGWSEGRLVWNGKDTLPPMMRHLIDSMGGDESKVTQSPMDEPSDFSSMQKFKPRASLTGEDGNIFNLMGIAHCAMRRADIPDTLITEMRTRVKRAANYDEALTVLQDYVEVD